jgi:hypothetical protein
MASSNALSLAIGYGLQGVKYSDFVQGTNAPSASDGTADVELRWYQTSTQGAQAITRESVVIAVRAILRLIEEGNVAAVSGFTPPPLTGASGTRTI